jgi:hypothetical protein
MSYFERFFANLWTVSAPLTDMTIMLITAASAISSYIPQERALAAE